MQNSNNETIKKGKINILFKMIAQKPSKKDQPSHKKGQNKMRLLIA